MRPQKKAAVTPAVAPLLLPLAFAAALAGLAALPRIARNPVLLGSFVAASALLVVWSAALWIRGRSLRVEVSLRPQHYLQAIAHTSIFVYWGWSWEPMRDAAALIVAQIVFAYAFDMLLVWSRRDTFTLGFGPFPIIFSTNLFLRFRDDWFYLQFLMVAVGFLAKELIRWERDGRRVHIFNPSSFPLAVASLLLIVTGTTQITWGEELATTLFQPPHIFLFIFLVALPGQYLFGVSTMTLSAVLTTYLLGLGYFAATGTYFFVDDYIPIAVFLGMHLLFTDPSTSPRTELGRIIYGVMYGATAVVLYTVLGRLGAPTFYDKLLQVPIMNVLVQLIDRAVRAPALQWLDPGRIARGLPQIRRNLVYTSLWVVFFGVMTYAGALGDHHPGHSVPFWQQACQEGRFQACPVLGGIHVRYCADGSGWACNEAGILMAEGKLADNSHASEAFQRSCALGFGPGCANAKRIASGGVPQHAPPPVGDYPILLREGKGAVAATAPIDLLDLACRKGWSDGCGALAHLYLTGNGVLADKPRAATLLDSACNSGSPFACSDLALMHKLGDGIPADRAKALMLLSRACDLRFANACRWLAEERSK